MNGALWDVLLAAVPGLPLLLALLWPAAALRPVLRALVPWAAVPGLALGALWAAGALPAGGPALMEPFLGGPHLTLDPTGGAFLLATALVWTAGGVFAGHRYGRDPGQDTFFVLFALTMAGNLGLVVAGDMITFYLAFVVMAFSAYGLVVHDGHPAARRAGRVYIVLTVLGDLAILAGIFALGAAAPGSGTFGDGITAAWTALARPGATPGPELTAGLLIGGFGVKAGLLSLHLWLPPAYREAPSAVGAVLGGAMINAGVLGWIRFLSGHPGLPDLAAFLFVVGIAAALYGAAAGLAQDDAKAVLAYSSVSQMGFVTVALGVMLRRPELAAVGAAAASVYAVHHGIAKGALFLSVGAADGIRGGRGRLLLLVGTALPALAISGAPLTSGARAKGVLKEAIDGVGGGWPGLLKPLLLLGALGTTLLLVRFMVLLHRREPESGEVAGRGGAGLVAPWALIVAASVAALAWLPFVAPSATPGFPALLHAPLEALSPVIAGIALGWLAHRRPGLLGPLAGIRIPVGDALVVVERLLHRVEAGVGRMSDGVSRAGKELSARVGSLGDALGRGAERLSRMDIILAGGTAMGVLILLVLGLFALSGSG